MWLLFRKEQIFKNKWILRKEISEERYELEYLNMGIMGKRFLRELDVKCVVVLEI